jgi:CRISPR system Cascade subunit CasA
VYPFYQVPGIEACEKKRYPAKKMNGLLVESNNKYTKKLPLFSMRSGKKKDELGYAEAARWLIYLLNFDDAALKPKSKMCHTANLGVVVAKGDSLFETLMLNLTLLQDGMKSWGEAKPLWERQKFSFEEFKERPAPVPDNQPELLTLQCRSVLLHREDKVVTSYTEFAGKYISEESAFEEQMTFWTEQKKNGVVGVYPKAHDQSRQMWRDFSVLLGRNEKAPKPGVVAWITMLQSKNLLPKGKFVSLGIVGIKYGEKSCGVSDEFSDTLQIHANLLDDLGKAWQEHIKNEIERCDKLAKAAGELGYGLNMAAGGNDKSAKQARQRAKEQAYYRLDIPFRQWLLQVDPEQDTEQQNACRMTWRDMSLKIVRNLGKEMADQAGNTAIVGRVDPEKRHHSAPEAFNSFLIRLKRIDQ